MSPELGIAIILALFWGPTGLWLVYRVLRGPRRTNPMEPFHPHPRRWAIRSSCQPSSALWASLMGRGFAGRAVP